MPLCLTNYYLITHYYDYYLLSIFIIEISSGPHQPPFAIDVKGWENLGKKRREEAWSQRELMQHAGLWSMCWHQWQRGRLLSMLSLMSKRVHDIKAGAGCQSRCRISSLMSSVCWLSWMRWCIDETLALRFGFPWRWTYYALVEVFKDTDQWSFLRDHHH